MLDVQTIRGSGRLVASDQDLSGFDSLEIRRGYDVRVVPADSLPSS
jgi:hypothetical protein